MKKQWTKDMQDKLKDFPQKAPEGLLDDIKSEMARRGLPITSASRPQRYATILRIASAAAVLLILFSISHLWEEYPITHPEYPQPIQPTKEVISSAPVEKDAEEADNIAPITSKLIAKVQEVAVSHTDTLATEETNVSNETEEEENQQEEKEGKKEEEIKNPYPHMQDKEPKPTPTKEVRKWRYSSNRRKTSSFALGAYYSGLVSQINSKPDYYEIMSAPPTSVPPGNESEQPTPPPSDNVESDSTHIAISSRSRSRSRKESGVKHRLPIKVGLSFRYTPNQRWYIQSGLTYSYLASEIPEFGQEAKQKLHYIGIPVQLGYQIWENKRFKGYVSAGGQVEKLISGKSTTHDLKGHTSSRNITDKRLQFSALVSVGAEYALGKDLSLYAEPGIHYYFKNGNGLKTYYNDDPLNFNITVGFRFHWEK